MPGLDSLITVPQYLAPHHALSRLAWRIARIENPVIKSSLIGAFLKCYDVALEEAERPRAADYASFNDFFTRALQPGTRPLPDNQSIIVSPADGAISQVGQIHHSTLLQAKGRHYSVAALLAGDTVLAKKFTDGVFATIYLAPHNYHRVHAPFGGKVTNVRYVPGRLFSVNHRTARAVDNLFARNERIVVELDTAYGSVAVILVGAMLVASMELTMCDVPRAMLNAGTTRSPYVVEPSPDYGDIMRGAELGRFNMGSTVIVLGERDAWEWLPDLRHGTTLRMGQALSR